MSNRMMKVLIPSSGTYYRFYPKKITTLLGIKVIVHRPLGMLLKCMKNGTKPANIKGGVNWTISEYTTGCLIGQGPSIHDALAFAHNTIIQNVGDDKTEEEISKVIVDRA